MFKTMTGVLDPRQKPSESEIEKIPSYIFCRWLSANPIAIQAANAINMYADIPIVVQYNMIKKAFASKIKYIPYPKKSEEDVVKDAELMSRHFNISTEKGKEYLTLISKEELGTIKSMYEKV